MISINNIQKLQEDIIAFEELQKKTLSVTVLSRFLNESEIRKLHKTYRQNVRIGKNRFDLLKRPTTKEEELLLWTWLSDEASTSQDIKKQFGKSPDYKVRSVALRYLYQNGGIPKPK